MSGTCIVDTNVILVANGQHEEVSPGCVEACVLKLLDIQRNGKLAVDDQYLVFTEYQKKTDYRTGKRVGDAFIKWALQNIRNEAKCLHVAVIKHPERGFDSFPDDLALLDFDRSDRVFVAVAAAHPDHPPIPYLFSPGDSPIRDDKKECSQPS